MKVIKKRPARKKGRADAMPQCGLAPHRAWMHEQFAQGQTYYQVWKAFPAARRHLCPPGQEGTPAKRAVEREFQKWADGKGTQCRQKPLTTTSTADIPTRSKKDLRAGAKKHGTPMRTIERASAKKSKSNAAAKDLMSEIQAAWREEDSKSFSVKVGKLPPPQLPSLSQKELEKIWVKLGEEDPDWKELAWMWLGARTYCPKCGRRRTDGELKRNWWKRGRACVESCCKGGCDPEPEELEATDDAARAKPKGGTARYYVTPQRHHWPVYDGTEFVLQDPNAPVSDDCVSMLDLPPAVAESLAVIDIKVDTSALVKKDSCRPATLRKGVTAPCAPHNVKKTGVVKAAWRREDIKAKLREPIAIAAYNWLYENNDTYRKYVDIHKLKLKEARDDPNFQWWVPTATLLLAYHGIEVAAKPTLYPRASFGDTDVGPRLRELGSITAAQKPSPKTSFVRKLQSRCSSYYMDFKLLSLIHDATLARQISSAINISKSKHLSVEACADDWQYFDTFWEHEREVLEDVVRQHGPPSLFITIAPAEWKYVLHESARRFKHAKKISDAQSLITAHIYQTVLKILEKRVFQPNEKLKIKVVNEWAVRGEYQGRGTLHLHICVWAELTEEHIGDGPHYLQGRSGESHDSALVHELENFFKCRVDVQVGHGTHRLLQYVTGYSAKASDSLTFKMKESEDRGGESLSTWAMVYRLLTRRAPLEPELTLEMMAVPLMVRSFRREQMYAPIPTLPGKPQPTNNYRKIYEAYLASCGSATHPVPTETKTTAKKSEVKAKDYIAKTDSSQATLSALLGQPVAAKDSNRSSQSAVANGPARSQETRNLLQTTLGAHFGASKNFCTWLREHQVEFVGDPPQAIVKKRFSEKQRGKHARKTTVGVGIRFPFEGLDIYIGAFASMFIPHVDPNAFVWRGAPVPELTQHLQGVLDFIERKFRVARPMKLLVKWVLVDMENRCLTESRKTTFLYRMAALEMLLHRTLNPSPFEDRIDVASWEAKRPTHLPARKLSESQAEVLEYSRPGWRRDDANNIVREKQFLVVDGGPGIGKTEVLAHVAIEAASEGCQVLIACPVGPLIDVYKDRLPASDNIVVETVHSSWKINRDGQEIYNPPGRLRRYNLIIFDETSQLDDDVFWCLFNGLKEFPDVFVIFAGDQQQLPPVHGEGRFKRWQERMVQECGVKHITLQQHEFARSTDPDLLDFLHEVRVQRPTRQRLVDFFGERH